MLMINNRLCWGSLSINKEVNYNNNGGCLPWPVICNCGVYFLKLKVHSLEHVEAVDLTSHMFSR